MKKINVTRVVGQEDNPFPIWVAKSRVEIALQEESRLRKNKDRSLSKLQLVSSRLAKRTEINEPLNLDDSDKDYQEEVDNKLSFEE